MLAQEKVPKEKGTRTTHPLRGFPAFLANPGVAHNSQFRYAQLLKQVRAYSPDWLRYSVSATGGVTPKPDGYATLYPSYINGGVGS